MTWDTSPNAVALRSVSTFLSAVPTMSAVTRVPRGMSFVAMTVGSVTGATVCVGDVPPGLFSSNAIPTNATTARNTPMSRTRRFERFKLDLPEPCDRWHHCSIEQTACDYTNGLGPLERIGRKTRTKQGDSQ